MVAFIRSAFGLIFAVLSLAVWRLGLTLGICLLVLVLSVLFLALNFAAGSVMFAPIYLILSLGLHWLPWSLTEFGRFSLTLIWAWASALMVLGFIQENVLGIEPADRSNSLLGLAKLRDGNVSLYMAVVVAQALYLSPIIVFLHRETIFPGAHLTIWDSFVLAADMVADTSTLGLLDIYHLHFSRIDEIAHSFLAETFRYAMNFDFIAVVAITLFGVVSYFLLGSGAKTAPALARGDENAAHPASAESLGPG